MTDKGAPVIELPRFQFRWAKSLVLYRTDVDPMFELNVHLVSQLITDAFGMLKVKDI